MYYTICLSELPNIKDKYGLTESFVYLVFGQLCHSYNVCLLFPFPLFLIHFQDMIISWLFWNKHISFLSDPESWDGSY